MSSLLRLAESAGEESGLAPADDPYRPRSSTKYRPRLSAKTDTSFILSGERGRNRTFNLLIKRESAGVCQGAPGYDFSGLGHFSNPQKPWFPAEMGRVKGEQIALLTGLLTCGATYEAPRTKRFFLKPHGLW
jgi:hypothetical protein